MTLSRWEIEHAPCFRVQLACIRCGRGVYRRLIDNEPEPDAVRCAGCGDDERGCVCPDARVRA